MSKLFDNLIKNVLLEHKGDEKQDMILKKKFASILKKEKTVDETVKLLFKAVQDHLKASGQQ